ncbi:MAG TPA: hypothetical protein VK203_28830 [Nostocaceae cyanobacterium]|nr:hypothetical protein [Nostocaceae cyanobacterium]
MSTNQKTNFPKSLIEISILTLLEELNDPSAEKLCGGSTTTPQATGQGQVADQNSRIDTSSIPSTDDFQQAGLKPFFPVLSNTKLPRLGPLDPAHRTPTKPQNAITITIPLPLPVS